MFMKQRHDMILNFFEIVFHFFIKVFHSIKERERSEETFPMPKIGCFGVTGETWTPDPRLTEPEVYNLNKYFNGNRFEQKQEHMNWAFIRVDK